MGENWEGLVIYLIVPVIRKPQRGTIPIQRSLIYGDSTGSHSGRHAWLVEETRSPADSIIE